MIEKVVIPEEMLKKIDHLPERQYKFWSPQEEAILERCIKENKDMKATADLLGRSLASVNQKAQAMGWIIKPEDE